MNVEDQAIRDGKMNGVYGVRNGVNAHIGARDSIPVSKFCNSDKMEIIVFSIVSIEKI